jgi:hypothetical protein
MPAKPLIRHSWRGPNYLGTQNAAEALSHRVADYWQSRGCEVEVRIESVPTKAGAIFVIRSNMRQGFPKNFRPIGTKLPEMEAA